MPLDNVCLPWLQQRLQRLLPTARSCLSQTSASALVSCITINAKTATTFPANHSTDIELKSRLHAHWRLRFQVTTDNVERPCSAWIAGA